YRSNALVAGVGNQDSAVAFHKDGVRKIKPGRLRGSSISGEALVASSSHGRNFTRGESGATAALSRSRHAADAIVGAVCDVEVSLGVERNSRRVPQMSVNGQAAISATF